MFVFNSILCVVQIPHVIKENYNEEKILQLMKLFDPITFYVIVQKVMFNLAMFCNMILNITEFKTVSKLKSIY